MKYSMISNSWIRPLLKRLRSKWCWWQGCFGDFLIVFHWKLWVTALLTISKIRQEHLCKRTIWYNLFLRKRIESKEQTSTDAISSKHDSWPIHVRPWWYEPDWRFLLKKPVQKLVFSRLNEIQNMPDIVLMFT